MTGDVARATAWLDRLAEAHEAATPGPWTERQDFIDQGVPDNSKTLNGGNGEYLGGIVLNYRDNDNAAAIVAAHNALPALLALARGVAELADELQGWRDNAERHSNSVDIGSAVYERSMGRARAYERAIDGLSALLADAAPDEEAR